MVIGDVADTATGAVITLDQLEGKLSGASVIYVGETHTSNEDHKAQLAILKRVLKNNTCTILGMEMFPRSGQAVLDRYIKGEITEEQFLQESKWDEVWGFPYQLYKGLIDFAREKHLRVLGLNAPTKVVRAIGRGGLGSLSVEERAQVARDFHLDDPKNRARIQKEYNVHGKEVIKDFESFFAAQLAWEETMAETIAEQLRITGGKCRIVVIVGKGHITDRLGIPYLANLRVPHEYRTIAPLPIDYRHGTVDPDIAQYVLITDKSEPIHRPRLGVKIQTAASGSGVEVIETIPNTPAAKADIRKGDIIIEVDGSPVGNPGEVQQAVGKGGPGHKISIERNKKKMTIGVTIE